MTRWLEVARRAGEISETENYEEIKSFVEKIGSNHIIQDKRVKIQWEEPFLILSKYNDFGDELKTKNKKGNASEKEGCPVLLSCQGSNLNSSVPETDVLPVTPQDNETANVQKLKLIRQTFCKFLLLLSIYNLLCSKTGRKEQNCLSEKKN